MSAADLILAVGVLVLLVVILGTMREMVILRGHVAALSQLITKPPAPSFIGGHLPAALAQEIAPRLAFDRSLRRAHVLVFLRTGCFGCEDLLRQLTEAVLDGELTRDDLSCIVSAASENSVLFEKAQTVSRAAIPDPGDALFRASEVKGTPAQLAIWTDSLEVFDYTIGGDVEWMRQRLQRQPSLSPALTRT